MTEKPPQEQFPENLTGKLALEHQPVDPEKSEPNFVYTFFPDKRQRGLFGKAVEIMIDRVRVTNQAEGAEAELTQNVIFLDKSARPLSVAFRALWQKKFPHVVSPHISFLNIGRKLKKITGIEMVGESELRIPLELTEEIERIKKHYIHLKDATPGSTVYIVDDVYASGFTQRASVGILHQAFPSLKFEYLALVQSREKHITPENYDRDNPHLFDQEVENLMTGGKVITTVAPWTRKGGGQTIKSPHGVTGVMDFDPPQNHWEERQQTINLTSVPYRKNEYYSQAKQSVRKQSYEKSVERIERALRLATEGCREFTTWEPDSEDSNDPRLEEAIEAIRQFQNRCRTFGDKKWDLDTLLPNDLLDSIPHISGMLERKILRPGEEGYFEVTIPQGIDKFIDKVWSILGIRIANKKYYGENFKLRKDSPAYKIDYAVHLIAQDELRDNFREVGADVKVEERVRSLRSEIKHIIDEYWDDRTKESNTAPR